MSNLKSSPELKAQIQRAAKIELSRRCFWDFCQTVAPDFYLYDRPHLITICETLQALYEGRIQRKDNSCEWKISEKANPKYETCKKLMMNVPPQHGKTRTLVNFAQWVLGKTQSEKIITCSYNDSTASDFSRYTRDGIKATKNLEDEIIYSDIFPATRIKRGNEGFEKWALEGQHFSYLGAGIGGSITSKGGTILIVDDPVKGAEEARNENHLNKIWQWYTGTFLSRVAAHAGEPIEIVNMTRWSVNDICGKILDKKERASDWYVLKMEVYDKKKDAMLCDDLFSKKRYKDQRASMDEDIFMANYHQEPFESRGLLFPKDELRYFRPNAERKFESATTYIDVADEGDDYLCAPMGKNIGPDIYITDVVFNKLNTDYTLPACAELIKKNKCEYGRVEANNMGAMFYKELDKLVSDFCSLYSATNTANKHTRILMAAGFIKKHCLFLHEDYWSDEYRDFMKNVCGYMKEGKSKHDDGPDALSGLIAFIQHLLSHYYE